MPFFIDDVFWRLSEANPELIFGLIVTPLTRIVCGGYPPFDMIWMVDTLCNYAGEVQEEENVETVNASLKENRLLYELGEITEVEYEATQKDLTKERKFWKKKNSTRARDLLNEK